MFGPSGERVSCDAVVHALQAGEDHPRWLGHQDGRYLVGADALGYLRAPTHRPHRERDYHGGERQHIQMCAGLSRLDVRGHMDTLVVSLPYYYCTLKDADYIGAMKERRKFTWEDAQGTHMVSFDEVVVTPQGVGALWLFQRDNPDADLQLAILMDIGSNTTDVVVVRRQPGGAWEFIREACTSWQDVCTTRFYDAWVKELEAEPGLAGYPFHYYGLMGRAREGRWSLRHKADAINLRPSFDRVATQSRRAVLSRLYEFCGSALWHEADKIVVTGGGAALMSADHPWSLDDKRILQLDTWANAEGQAYHVSRP